MENSHFPYNLHLPLSDVGIGIKSYRNKLFNGTAIKPDSIHAISANPIENGNFTDQNSLVGWKQIDTSSQDVRFCVGLTELKLESWLLLLCVSFPFPAHSTNITTTTHIPIYNYLIR